MLTEDDRARMRQKASQRALKGLETRLEGLDEGDEKDAVQLAILYHRRVLGVS